MGVALFWLSMPVVFCVGRAVVWGVIDGGRPPRSGRNVEDVE